MSWFSNKPIPLTWFLERRRSRTPGTYTVTYRYRRRFVDLQGRAWVEQNAIRDTLVAARSEKVRVTGTVIATAWGIETETGSIPFAAPAVERAGDTLTLTITLEHR